MKKFFAIIAVAIAAVFTANTADAQTRANQEAKTVSIRPYVGLSATAVVDSDVDVEAGGGVTLGADAQYMFNNWFGVSAGAEFINGGWKFKEGVAKGSEVTINTLGAPILANFYVCKGLDIKLGVKPTFILNSDVTKDDAGNKHELKGNDELNTFDVNGVIGISYEHKNFVFELRENVCTSNLLKHDDSSYDKAVKMGNVSLSIGYRF